MKDYKLVRVGMNVGENRWFSHHIQPAFAETIDQQVSGEENGQGADGTPQRQFSLALILKRLRKHREKREQERDLRQRRKLFEEEHAMICQELEEFLSELNHLVDQRYECRCVYGDAVRKALIFPEGYSRSDLYGYFQGDSQESKASVPSYWLPQLWQQYWHISEFDAYLQPQWVEPLLENARLHHFVVLGFAACTPAVILHCARRMKSLRWIMQEKDCTEEIQDFVEEFYEDYGLAVTLQPLEGGKAFTRLLLVSGEPVCVLDFTGEPHISPGGVAGGSIWIDFCSVEEKARRILERGEGVSYFSLKEIWKRAGKP